MNEAKQRCEEASEHLRNREYVAAIGALAGKRLQTCARPLVTRLRHWWYGPTPRHTENQLFAPRAAREVVRHLRVPLSTPKVLYNQNLQMVAFPEPFAAGHPAEIRALVCSTSLEPDVDDSPCESRKMMSDGIVYEMTGLTVSELDALLDRLWLQLRSDPGLRREAEHRHIDIEKVIEMKRRDVITVERDAAGISPAATSVIVTFAPVAAMIVRDLWQSVFLKRIKHEKGEDSLVAKGK